MKYLLLILLLITPRGSLSRLRLSPTQQALHLETFSNYTRTFTTSSDVRVRFDFTSEQLSLSIYLRLSLVFVFHTHTHTHTHKHTHTRYDFTKRCSSGRVRRTFDPRSIEWSRSRPESRFSRSGASGLV